MSFPYSPLFHPSASVDMEHVHFHLGRTAHLFLQQGKQKHRKLF